MKDTLIIGAAILVAIALGAWLLMSGKGTAPEGPAQFSVLDSGTDSGAVTERKNFRIKTQEELQTLWQLVNSQEEAPVVDFNKQEVLAVFDGTHSSGGYGVEIISVTDTAAARTVAIRRSEPGDSCVTTDALTSPYVIVVLPKTDAPLSRDDVTETNECS